MSEIRTFFRYCPACGRRFEIRLVGKELIGEKELVAEEQKSFLPRGGMFGTHSVAGYPTLEEHVPMIIDLKEFRYTYRCKHCGHVWSEIKGKEDGRLAMKD